MRGHAPANHPTWDEADAAFEAFLANMPVRRRQLKDRLTLTDGPALDGTVASLTPLAAWYFETAIADCDDDTDWWPEWLPERDPNWNPGPLSPPRPVSAQLLRLWTLVAIYVGDVIEPLIPHARWVCWRAEGPREITAGSFVLDTGDARYPCDPLMIANPGVTGWYIYRGTGRPEGTRPDSAAIEANVRRYLNERGSMRGNRASTWQRGPTGPLASKRIRTPDWESSRPREVDTSSDGTSQ